MAEDKESKTEEATPKKIQDARKKGNVPKSQDTAGIITLIVAVIALYALFMHMKDRVFVITNYYLNLIGTFVMTPENIVEIAFITIKEVLFIVLPLALTIAFAGVLGNIGQFGFLFTTDPLKPKLEKLNFIKGMKNLISIKKLIDGIKITLKSSVVLMFGFYYFFMFAIPELPTVALLPLYSQLHWLLEHIIIVVLIVLAVILVFAIADLIITRTRYKKDLKMTKQEVKDEMKNMEGNPEIKAKIRQKMMEVSMKRMMSSVPTADVVITNPTHYAVAIRYEEGRDHAPLVVAKGTDTTALKIKEIARESGVHVVQNPPLARALYAQVDIDEPIPESLFHAVAEVLAYVYKLNKNG